MLVAAQCLPLGGLIPISSRYLASLELGNNQMSIEKLIKLTYALEVDPVELFSEILHIYQDNN